MNLDRGEHVSINQIREAIDKYISRNTEFGKVVSQGHQEAFNRLNTTLELAMSDTALSASYKIAINDVLGLVKSYLKDGLTPEIKPLVLNTDVPECESTLFVQLDSITWYNPIDEIMVIQHSRDPNMSYFQTDHRTTGIHCSALELIRKLS